AEARDRVGEALAGDALFAEEQDGLFDDGEHFLAVGEDLVEEAAARDLLAPAPADADAVAVGGFVKGVERALADAAAAVVAGLGIDVDLAVLHLGDLDRAGVDDLADLAAAALVELDLRHALADDAQVVQ